MKCMLILAVCVFALVLISLVEAGKKKKKVKFIYATCEALPNPEDPASKVQGTVQFKQKSKGGPVAYKVKLTGFNNTDSGILHGWHVHAYGTIMDGCAGAGPHYNPLNMNHGGPLAKERHIGDLGNLIEDVKGNVEKIGLDKVISLQGKFSILGRGLVIHSGEDDLGLGGDEGSLLTGNSGSRLACCAIVASDGEDF